MPFSKQEPSRFDCHELALPDEPMFVLLARDESAPDKVVSWALTRLEAIRDGKKPITDLAMVKDAMDCAVAMAAWRQSNKGDDNTQAPKRLPTWYNRQTQYRDQKAFQELVPPRSEEIDPWAHTHSQSKSD